MYVCVCVCLQAHVYGNAWRPEDEQPHGDEHYAGSLPRGSQNPGGVPDSLKAHLTEVTHLSLLSLLIMAACGKLWSNSGSASDFTVGKMTNC